MNILETIKQAKDNMPDEYPDRDIIVMTQAEVDLANEFIDREFSEEMARRNAKDLEYGFSLPIPINPRHVDYGDKIFGMTIVKP